MGVKPVHHGAAPAAGWQRLPLYQPAQPAHPAGHSWAAGRGRGRVFLLRRKLQAAHQRRLVAVGSCGSALRCQLGPWLLPFFGGGPGTRL